MIWLCGKYKLDTADKPLIMGILNLTPDSFSDGGRFNTIDKALVQAVNMIEQGADIIDMGGESTRPGAAKVTVEEEIARVVPVIEALSKKTDIPISVDTYKPEVARRSLEIGASIVNDISGLRFDQKMGSVIARYKAGLVLMHIKGTPEDMQQDPQYEDLLGEIKSYLTGSIQIALDAGVKRSAIAIDPGIGFGKTVEHNLSLIKNLAYFKDLECPILVGVSRKSFIGKLNNDIPADERLPGSLAAAILAVQNGASIIRCHDVAETKQALRMAQAITTP